MHINQVVNGFKLGCTTIQVNTHALQLDIFLQINWNPFGQYARISQPMFHAGINESRTKSIQ